MRKYCEQIAIRFKRESGRGGGRGNSTVFWGVGDRSAVGNPPRGKTWREYSVRNAKRQDSITFKSFLGVLLCHSLESDKYSEA